MDSWARGQLSYAFGIGGYMSFYGIVGLIVYMLPSTTASYNQKIVIIALVLLTMPFTLLVGWLVTRRSAKKERKAAEAAAVASGTAPIQAAAETGNGAAIQPAKLTTPAGIDSPAPANTASRSKSRRSAAWSRS